MISDMLSKLTVLTDLVEFAQERMEVESPYTSTWCDANQLTDWLGKINGIRAFLPEDVVKDFDDERRRVKEFRQKLGA